MYVVKTNRTMVWHFKRVSGSSGLKVRLRLAADAGAVFVFFRLMASLRLSKSEPQKVYRLEGMRQGTSRFEAAVSRGLITPIVWRS
jgi:hypothetical protein